MCNYSLQYTRKIIKPHLHRVLCCCSVKAVGCETSSIKYTGVLVLGFSLGEMHCHCSEQPVQLSLNCYAVSLSMLKADYLSCQMNLHTEVLHAA